MNFVGHSVAAHWHHTSAVALLGAMLPDFATMCQVKLTTPSHPQLAAGVRHHYRTDAVFHRLSRFTSLEREARARFKRAGMNRGTALGAAHVGVELLLDGELLRQPDVAQRYLAALAEGHADSLRKRGAELAITGWPELHQRLSELRQRGAPHFYRDANAVAEVLARILRHRPRLAPNERDEYLLRSELPAVQRSVALDAAALMSELRAELSRPP